MTRKHSKPEIDKVLTKSANKFPVVGVGASSGGLSAFKIFLKSIPENSGMAYVLVQHLDPGHESLLPELLQKVTEIPVQQISDDIKVEPDTIYIIPSNKMLLSNDGKLELSPRPEKGEKILNLPIDLFFESLAEVHQSHSIGVVLTGNGYDGTQGLRSIKNHGGITFAQDEESAEYKGMPGNAVQEGVVDFVLPPEKIPKKILEVIQTLYDNEGQEKTEINENPEIFRQILALLRIRKGTDFTYYKQTTIRRRILRRMALSNKDNPSEYLEFLREHKAEQDVLYQDLLIPVTNFFRDTTIFDNICESLLPGILKSKTGYSPVRIWVAGCSTGQEVYTIAMCLLELLDEKESEEKVQIFGTDISEPAIAKSRSGIYKKTEVEGLSPERLERFFNKIDNGYQIKKEVRERCVFALHNFLQDPPFGRMDLISCRNVLIYMQPYLQKKALTTFHYALKKGGHLFLGKSETINSVPDLFTPSEKQDKIFTRRDKAGKFMPITSARSEESFRNLSRNIKTENAQTDFQRTADDVILSKYTPAGVVVDETMEIVHFRGSTGAYLEPQSGKPSLNLLKMAKSGLAFELRTIIHHAKKEGESVLKENVPLQDNNSPRLISIEAIPLLNLAEPHYLILFHDLSTDPRLSQKLKDQKITSEKSETDEKDLRIDQLEKELAQTREDMRSITEDQENTNEELQSANEELQSGSEELQTLNEELETSKEELQSTNEEFTSVNKELLSLNKNLTAARNFAVDILNTVRDPWVVLDKNFRVKSASTTFYKVFHTSKEKIENKDIFSLGNEQWNSPQLKKLLEKVLTEKLFISDFEVTHDFPEIGERTMALNAREITREDGGEKLILLVFGDITDKRIAEKTIEKNEVKFKLLVETIPQLIWISDAEGKSEYSNAKWRHYTGMSSPESLESNWINFVHPEDLPSVLENWKECLKKGTFFSMEYRLKNTQGEYNWFLAKALPLYDTDGEIIKWFGSYTNIEIQKEAEQALRKSSEYFRELAELVPEKVSHADVNGKVDYFNKSWVRYTGMSLEDLKNDGWVKLLHPEEKENVVRNWRTAIEAGQNFEMELRFLSKEGNYNWHLAQAIPVKDKEGRIKQWIGATTEIQRFKEEEKRKEGFLQLVSHELKTPITSIKGYVQLLLSMLQNDKTISLDKLPLEPSLRRIDDQVGRLTRLISEMLDLSRIEENKLELKKENFSLNKLIDNTVQDINNTDIEHDITVHHELNCNVNADKDRIGQVIINFITNAIKYSPERKEVEVKIHAAEGEKVAVSVRDYGIGIAEADQKEIFKRFHRVTGKNEDTYSGLGIGLFVAQEIIERHHGSITVRSKLNEGSEFTFTLPYASGTSSND